MRNEIATESIHSLMVVYGFFCKGMVSRDQYDAGKRILMTGRPAGVGGVFMFGHEPERNVIFKDVVIIII